MKTKLLLLFLILSQLVSAQSVKLALPNLENEITVNAVKNINDGLDVTVKDSKNNGLAGTFTLTKDKTSSDLMTNVYNKISEVSNNYYFIIKNVNVSLKIDKNNVSTLTLPIATTAVSNLDQESFIALIKTKTIFNNDMAKTTFTQYITSLVNNTTKDVFSTSSTLKLTKSAGVVSFTDSGITQPVDTTNENKFYISLFNLYKGNTTIIQTTFFTAADLASLDKNINFKNTSNDSKLDELFTQAMGKSDYEFINNYYLVDLTTVAPGTPLPSKLYAVSIKNNFAQNFFTLKFCDDTGACSETMQMPYDVDRSQFGSNLLSFIKGKLNQAVLTLKEVDIENLYGTVKKNNEKKIIEKNAAADSKKMKDLIEQIENLETQYSGILKLNKSVSVYSYVKPKDKSKNEEVWHYKEEKNIKFIVSDTTVYVRFFNNKVKDILIKGYLDDNPEQKFRVMNVSYSFPFRSFNNSKHYLPISPSDNKAKGYYICINDLFEYDNMGKSWNYSVRNKEYTIEPEKATKLEQRKLMDFFTGVIFTDVFGLNSANANNLLQAEAKIKVPLWIYNFGHSTLLHSINADVNASIYNGFDETGRFISDGIPVMSETDSTKVKSFAINNFDLIKHNNFNAGINFNIYNIEFKGLSTEWSFGYGLRYYRSDLRYTVIKEGSEDITKTYHLNSLTHEIITNLEIRPQLNFGADLNIAYNFINARGATDNVGIDFKEDDNIRDRTAIRVQLNFYSKLNPDKSNDGIFARVGGFYHVGARDFYPQILVGYATNLSSFVNSFKKTSK